MHGTIKPKYNYFLSLGFFFIIFVIIILFPPKETSPASTPVVQARVVQNVQALTPHNTTTPVDYVSPATLTSRRRSPYFFTVREATPSSFKFVPGNRKFKSIGEKLCCQALEEYLGRQVSVNTRPAFLVNPATGKKLELDLFDIKTNIAIEYNGAQHYSFSSHFHKKKDDFVKQQQRDKFKSDRCYERGIHLIVIPYMVDCCKLVEGQLELEIRSPQHRLRLIKDFLYPKLDELLM